MKWIVAFVKPIKMADVTMALHEVEGLSGVTVCDVRGFGRGRAEGAPDKAREQLLDFLPRIRLEIACPDDKVDDIVATIERNAHTGLRGDGKVYVSDLEQAVRISTGERGDEAI